MKRNKACGINTRNARKEAEKTADNIFGILNTPPLTAQTNLDEVVDTIVNQNPSVSPTGREVHDAMMDLYKLCCAIDELLDNVYALSLIKFDPYLNYCWKKMIESREFASYINEFNETVFHLELSKRPDLEALKRTHLGIAEQLFQLLDDLDTAGDIFKPTWNWLSSTVEMMHRNRWLYWPIIGHSTPSIGGLPPGPWSNIDN